MPRRNFLVFLSSTRKGWRLKYPLIQRQNMSSGQEQQSREDFDAKAREGETGVPCGTGGKTLEAQENLAQGRKKGGETRKEEVGSEGYKDLGSRGGHKKEEYGGVRVHDKGDDSSFAWKGY